jgi:hypothetical protein
MLQSEWLIISFSVRAHTSYPPQPDRPLDPRNIFYEQRKTPLRVKQPERETERSPPKYNVMNAHNFPSTTLYVFIMWG